VRGFDGGIDGEQVGLCGDLGHTLSHFLQIAGGLQQLGHARIHLMLVRVELAHLCDDLLELSLALREQDTGILMLGGGTASAFEPCVFELIGDGRKVADQVVHGVVDLGLRRRHMLMPDRQHMSEQVVQRGGVRLGRGWRRRC